MPTIYQFCATIAKITDYDDNGKPRTRIVQWSPVAGLVAVIFIDSVTCALIMYCLLTMIYMPIIRAYLALVFTSMGSVASFAEMFIVAFSVTTCVFTAIIMRSLVPVYGPGGSPYANVLTLIETSRDWIYRA